MQEWGYHGFEGWRDRGKDEEWGRDGGMHGEEEERRDGGSRDEWMEYWRNRLTEGWINEEVEVVRGGRVEKNRGMERQRDGKKERSVWTNGSM